MKKYIITGFVMIIIVLAIMFIVSAEIKQNDNFLWKWNGTDAEIHSYEFMDDIRDTCQFTQENVKDINDFCNRIMMDDKVKCVSPIDKIRSSCMVQYINSTLLSALSQGTFLPCTSPSVKGDWKVSWNISESGEGTFTFCKG